MQIRSTVAAVGVIVAISGFPIVAQTAQSPGGAQSVPSAPGAGGLGSTPAASTARLAGRILAADTGKPLRYAGVILLLQPSQTSRSTETDAYGRYEFAELPAGRYSVRPSKDGYVFVAPDPFALGIGVNLSEGQIADRVDIAMSRGSVITGRITDEFGDPVAGATVYAVRYIFTPSGQRELRDGTFGNFVMPAATNDRGDYRLFGLKPGSYYVFASHDLAQPVAIGPRPGGISNVASDRGFIATYYPGTSSVVDAQPVRVELNRDTNASFALSPSHMARIGGTVSDSQGRPALGGYVSLRDATNTVGWFSQSSSEVRGDGTFEIANVAPGNYVLDVRPTDSASRNGSSGMEYATVALTVSGDDMTNLEVVTRSGVSVSGRVIFEGKSDIAQPDLHIYAVDEEAARNMISYRGSDDGLVAPDGQFNIPGAFGRVLFRTGFLPQNVMLKAVSLNGTDITNTPYDTTGSDNIVGLEVVLVDKQSRVVGHAKNARGEVDTNYRLVIYPTNLRAGDVAVRFQHNASANDKGQVTINRMPPGDYVGLAVKGVQPGEEWDPDLRKRIEERGRRFTLKEDETLELEFPMLE